MHEIELILQKTTKRYFHKHRLLDNLLVKNKGDDTSKMPDFTKDDRLYKNVCFKLIEIHGVLFLLSYSSEVNVSIMVSGTS